MFPIIIYCSACSINKKQAEEQKVVVSSQNDNTVTEFASETADVWTPTFQLCWNELADLLKTDIVNFKDETPELAKEFNKKKFTKNDLNEKDYYISVSKQTLKHKREIEKAIKQKFNEKSDILGQFNFQNVRDDQTNLWFIYSILIKNFPFVSHFEVLKPDFFNNKEDVKYKYFGSMPEKKSKDFELLNSITGLFYVNDNDFALKIKDKTGEEEMILYLTNSDKSFDEIYSEIKEKAGKQEEYQQKRTEEIKAGYDYPVEVTYSNYYKYPYLEIDETLNFDKELSEKVILAKDGTPFVIAKTIQTIKFKMNEEGAKLKSEAAISVKATAMRPQIRKITVLNKYYFDRPFVIFLKETGKDKPYFAARINDGKYLVKEK